MVPAHDAAHGVAIIGISCRFPGAHDKEAFWALLRAGRDVIGEIDSRRWPARSGADEAPPRWAGLMAGVDEFDAEFFQISPREARQMDPQQRLLLQEAWHCLEDAGVAPGELRRARTAVFAGTMAADYRQRLVQGNAQPESFSYLGNAGALLANRISHVLGLRGESKTIDAACASSLVALHDAKRTLERGEADFALVAAANVICHPWKHDSFAHAHMLSPTGRCRTFSAQADGYVPGEGAAVLLLQRVAEAQRARRRIYGLVRGSAVNHCGASPTVTSPSIAAQRDVIRAALESAALPASGLSYIEAHGTGTSLGDPIEIEALHQVFAGENGAHDQPTGERCSAAANGAAAAAAPHSGERCVIGSVKTNIGHLEAAAGLAGVIKVLLMFRAREIPPTLHCAPPNPIIDFSRTRFELATSLRVWPASQNPSAAGHGQADAVGSDRPDTTELPRRAGVSSFGFGGVNAHVILEEPPLATAAEVSLPERPAQLSSRPLPFVLSARSASALRELIASWRRYVGTERFARTDLVSLCLTLACGREHGAWRAGGTVGCHEDIRRLVYELTPARIHADPRVALIFASDVASADTIARWQAADPTLAKHVAANAVTSVAESGAAPAAESFAFFCSVGERLHELGVRCRGVGGEGAGRYAALATAGCVSVEDAWRLAQNTGAPVMLRRPHCAVYGFGPEPLLPVHVSAELIEQYRRETVSVSDLRRCLETAQQLIGSQPTFARLMREWEPHLGTADIAATIAAVLRRDPSATADHAADLRLFIIVQTCRRRLSRKWELPDVEIHPAAARVFTELLVANALKPAQFIALFDADADLLAFTREINAHMASLPAAAIEKLAAALPDEPLSSARLGGAAPSAPWGTESQSEASGDAFVIRIGTATPAHVSRRPESFAFSLELDGARAPAEQWVSTLLALWQHGAEIDWPQWSRHVPYPPAALPAYPFERKSYWFDAEAPADVTTPKAEQPVVTPAKISLRPPDTPAPATLPALRTNMPGSLPRLAPAESELALALRRPAHRSLNEIDVANADAVLPWHVADGIATLRLAGRSEHNCFTDTLITAFETRLAQIATDSRIKVVVITNDGPHFCAGGTAAFIDQLRRGERTFADLSPFYRGLLECPVPVVNAVAGHAFGGGLAFALFGDVVVLAAESRYSANFLSLGFSPGMGATLIVPEKLGPDVSARLLYSGQTLSGHELAVAGARVQVVEKARVLTTGFELARDFARQSRLALEVLKRQMAAPLLARLVDHEARELAGHQLTLRDRASDAGAGSFTPTPAADTPAQPLFTGSMTAMASPADPPSHATPAAIAPGPAQAVVPSSARLISDLQEIAGKLLLMQAVDVDPTKAFRELGMDSVLTVELAKAISRRWSIEVDAAVLYEFPSLARLAQHLQGLVVPTSVPPAHSAEVPTSSPLPAAPIDGIAVIGMAVRYPGADNLDEFWRNLANGVDAVTAVPTDRWDADAVFDANPDSPGKTNSRWGGFLQNIHEFDPLFFKISPSEAEAMDPQQRLFLQEAWHALEHAGYGGLHEARCGVFVGVSAGDYAEHLARAGRGDSAEAFMGLAPSILASRISYLLDLRGPSLAIDTACSSSLVAVHQACQSLREGDCDMALAGGVTLMTTPQLHVRTGHAHMLSPTGRCRPFGSAADGIALGEGVGVVVLKPLARAIAAGDTVYAVIRGSGVNQDGATNGITAPSARAQEELIRSVLARANVAPASIQYVEAHGTGTPLGDPIELRALSAVFGEAQSLAAAGASKTAARVALGSVKSNLGHTVCAAGVAGLIKAVLALRHAQIPPSLHFGTGNPRIDFAGTPFFVPTAPIAWSYADIPRRAAVSSFGFSGTNAHVVLEEFRPTLATTAGHDRPLRFALSAQTPAALRRSVEAWRGFLAQPDAALPGLDDICFTQAVGRARLKHEVAFAVRDLAALRTALDAFSRGDAARDDTAAAEIPSRGRRVALPLYPFERVRCWAVPVATSMNEWTSGPLAANTGERSSPPPKLDGGRTSVSTAARTEPRALGEASTDPTDPLEQLLELVSRNALSVDAAEREIVRRELLPH